MKGLIPKVKRRAKRSPSRCINQQSSNQHLADAVNTLYINTVARAFLCGPFEKLLLERKVLIPAMLGKTTLQNDLIITAVVCWTILVKLGAILI